MTCQKELQRIMDEIWHIQLKATALGWSSRQKYEAYEHLLPPEVMMIDFPSTNLNCAGYALDLGRTTSEPETYLDKDYDEIDSALIGGIYVLYHGVDWIHLGKITDENRATSKWGWDDPIFEHPINFYPGSWNVCKYFKRKGSI
ncbi:MAG: hypothetical protein U9Q92_06165 [archaeon]|nr:hypothetical protein [archaeon]